MFITIRASEGYILTDGKDYAETISLAENTSIEKYHEITIEEYKAILAKKEQEMEIENEDIY